MAADRPAMPAVLKRSVLVEAGHRCAIPTCRQTPIEIANIEPFAQVKKHEFPNLIALCPTCHARYDREDIDRKAMCQYKANLGLLTSRYGEVERRVIEYFAENPNESTVHLPGGMQLLVRYLSKDGYLDIGEPYMASDREHLPHGEPARVEIDRRPGEPEELTPAHPEHDRAQIQCETPFFRESRRGTLAQSRDQAGPDGPDAAATGPPFRPSAAGRPGGYARAEGQADNLHDQSQRGTSQASSQYSNKPCCRCVKL